MEPKQFTHKGQNYLYLADSTARKNAEIKGSQPVSSQMTENDGLSHLRQAARDGEQRLGAGGSRAELECRASILWAGGHSGLEGTGGLEGPPSARRHIFLAECLKILAQLST